MAAKKYGNYQTKKVKFNGKDLTLYSMDGVTWSSRPEELQAIVDRHNLEKAACSSDLKGEEREGAPLPKAQPKRRPVVVGKAAEEDVEDSTDEESVIGDDYEPDIDDVEAELDSEDQEDAKPKRGPKIPAAPIAKASKVPAPRLVHGKGKDKKKSPLLEKKAKITKKVSPAPKKRVSGAKPKAKKPAKKKKAA